MIYLPEDVAEDAVVGQGTEDGAVVGGAVPNEGVFLGLPLERTGAAEVEGTEVEVEEGTEREGLPLDETGAAEVEEGTEQEVEEGTELEVEDGTEREGTG